MPLDINMLKKLASMLPGKGFADAEEEIKRLEREQMERERLAMEQAKVYRAMPQAPQYRQTIASLHPLSYTYTLIPGGAIPSGAVLPSITNPAGLPEVDDFSIKDVERVWRLEGQSARKVKRPAHIEAEVVPDCVVTLIGWRGWRVGTTADGKLRLKSLAKNTLWEPKRPMVGRHINGEADLCCDEETLGKYCSCGIWALPNRADLMNALSAPYPNVAAIGTVEMWGRVIEHELGFRAQYAYPKELWLLKPGLEDLGWIYDVPIRSEFTY